MKCLMILFFSLTVVISAQVAPNPSSFFPSEVGNIWEYSSQSSLYKVEITIDSVDVENNHFLFYRDYFNSTRPLYKIDHLYNVYAIHTGVDSVLYHYYKLDADLGETWRVQIDPPATLARVDSVYTDFLWGEERYIKKIGYYRPPYPYQDTTVTDEAVYEKFVLLVSDIGEYYEFNWESGPTKILLGCVIGDITYGTVGVEDEIQIIPAEFVLYQNYPNPFNPSTTIEFDLAVRSKVILKIYNILGEEVKTLVDNYLHAGNHRVTFDAQSVYGGVSSGIYIYSLTAGQTNSSKIMVLQK